MSATTKADYDRQLGWRLKQIEIGKSSSSYSEYARAYPRHKRRREHPSTPDPYDARMSKRQYEGRVKAWKRTLHDMYPHAGDSLVHGPSFKLNFFLKYGEDLAYSEMLQNPCINLVSTARAVQTAALPNAYGNRDSWLDN